MYRPWRLPFNSSNRCAAGAAPGNQNPDQPFEQDRGGHYSQHDQTERLADAPCQLLAGKERGMQNIEPDRIERNHGREQQGDPGPARSHSPRAPPGYTIIMTGFSISCLKAPISSAPSAPSMAR